MRIDFTRIDIRFVFVSNRNVLRESWCVFTFVLVKCLLKEIVHRRLLFFHFVLTGNAYEIPHLTQNFIHNYIIFVDWKAISLRHFLFNTFAQNGLVFCRFFFLLALDGCVFLLVSLKDLKLCYILQHRF